MRVYLSSPVTQMQADACNGLPVLLSYPLFRTRPGIVNDYAPSFERLLLDSGAYSQLTDPTLKIDAAAYAEWAQELLWADAWAGLDDISGDWHRSLENYRHGGFPTFHDSDPPELLPELVAMAAERGGWIGIGLVPPRHGKRDWMRRTLDQIPERLHVHGWACGIYSDIGGRGLDSIDSTTWMRAADALRMRAGLEFLTPREAIDIEIKRILRRPRMAKTDDSLPLFDSAKATP